MDSLTARAITAAVEIAAGLGLRGVQPVLLKDGANCMVQLAPSPIVARIMTTTSWLRRPPQVWLQRDLDVAAYLHSLGALVVPPSAEIAPGPHLWTPKSFLPAGESEQEALWLSFWTYFERHGEHRVTPEESMPALSALHQALETCPVELPYMGLVLDEIPHWLKWLEVRRRLSGSDLIQLREAHWKLAGRLRPNRSKTQVLHGDAHCGNLLRTADGLLLWTDFEDTCKGPVAWDVATLVYGEPDKEDELLALYPGAPSRADLQPYLEARELEAVVYMQVLATRYAERAGEAAERLAIWQHKVLF